MDANLVSLHAQLDAIKQFIEKPQVSTEEVDLHTDEEMAESDNAKFMSGTVMYEYKSLGQLPNVLQKLHKEWDLLDYPCQLPQAKSDIIDSFIEKCTDEEFSNQFCTPRSVWS